MSISPVTQPCPNCGEATHGTVFCESCGTRLAATAAPQVYQAPVAQAPVAQPPTQAPAYGYAQQPAYAYAAPMPGTNGFAIAALIFGLLGGTLIPIILGHVALSQIKQSGQQGHGMALAGAVFGYLWAAFWLILIIVAASSGHSSY